MTGAVAVWSNQLFGLTLVIYTLGMLAFAIDAAFGRRLRIPSAPAQRPPVEAAHARAVELVIAGAPGASAAPSERSIPGHVPPPHAPPATTTPQIRRTTRVAVALTAAGWLVHLAEVVTRGIAAGRVPWGNMYEFSSAVSLIAVGVFLVLAVRGAAAELGVYLMVPVVSYLGLAGTVLYTRAAPLQPVLNSYWIKIHVVAAIAATGTFMVGGVVTLLLLLRRWHDRRHVAAARASMLGRLPAATALDELERRVITLAFPVWTFAIIAGAVWAEAAWGRYWGWDPKETWSFVTWVLYAAYLHARATASWRRAAPAFALAGFLALIFNYYVVNLVINGLHSYAGV